MEQPAVENAPAPGARAMRPATQRLLDAPILRTLGRLAGPPALLALFQTAISIGDTYFVGRLGTAPLAGLALVFPLIMLLQMTSAGAMGGGVSSAIARALGAGEEEAARALVAHGLVIALVLGLAFTALLLGAGAALYRLLGGRADALAQALAYSNIVFSGAIAVWVANTLASVLRGSGNTLVPSAALILAATIHVPLSGTLTLGAFGLPRLGIAGAGVAYVTTFSLASVAMALYVWRTPLRPTRMHWRLEWRRFREILRVGAVSSLSALQTVLTAVIVTGFVGRYGTAALAGYGVGVRLELLQVPLVFSIGQAMLPMVGTHVGAGFAERAKRIAWTGAAIAGGVSLAIGVTVAIVPEAWVRIFSDDPQVLEAGRLYLRIVGPCYTFLGIAIVLYFASQGSGHVVRPVLAGTARLVLVVGGAALVVALGGPLWAVFALVGTGLVVFGSLTALAVQRTDWARR
ncbi:MAG: MATE family efflux transporter [Burkholderiales bacterium]|nr:MATE family efflux transporter [Burkholderiales bacterium]